MYNFISIVGPNMTIQGADGKDYILAPLGFGEIAEYLEWYKWKPYTEFKRIMQTAPLSPALENAEELKIFTECKDRVVSPDMPEVVKSYTSIDGMAKQLYLSLRVGNPALKESYLCKIINSENINEIFVRLRAISGIFPEKGVDDEVKPDDLGETTTLMDNTSL